MTDRNDPPDAPDEWAAPGQQGGPPPGYPPAPYPGHPYPPYSGHPPPPYPPGAYAPPGYPPPAPRPGIIPLRPLRLGDLLDGAIKLIQTNPRATLGLSAVVAAVTAVPQAVGEAFYFRSVGGRFDTGDTAGTDDAAAVGQFATTVGSTILTFIASTILAGILTRVLGRAVFGGRISAGEAWRLTRSRVWALFGLVLLSSLIIAAPLLVVAGLLLALWAVGAGGGSLALVGVVGGIGAAVLAGILAVRFNLAAPVLVLERRRVVESLRRSWVLVKGDSWRVFGIVLLTGLIASLLGGVLSIPFVVGGVVLGEVSSGSTAAAVAAGLLAALSRIASGMVTYPFQAGVIGLLYTDRRMRAEAFDLVLQTAGSRLRGPVDHSVDDLWLPTEEAAAAS
jgi:hypothetical protein